MAIVEFETRLIVSGTAPQMPVGMHSVPEIMTLYNFPPGLDGRGQTIGLLEFGGSLISGDIAQYFKSLDLPPLDVSTISVDGVNYRSGSDADGEVMINVELVGSIAPRAHIRVYFAKSDAIGYANATRQAVADHVSVLATGWGQPEVSWKDEELKTIDAVLAAAARQGITVVAAAGDSGVTDGMVDGHPHVDFPASSPWVLSVGGTTLKSEGNRIASETVYKDGSGRFATGGGFSEKFGRLDWQSTVSVPPRSDSKSGRGVPDVVAIADPNQGIPVIVHGRLVPIGGTSEQCRCGQDWSH